MYSSGSFIVKMDAIRVDMTCPKVKISGRLVGRLIGAPTLRHDYCEGAGCLRLGEE